MLNLSLLTKFSCSFLQKCDLNLVSQYEIILTGTPWNLTTCHMYFSIKVLVDYLIQLDDMSSFCETIHDNPYSIVTLRFCGWAITKSIVIFFHLPLGIGSGCSRPSIFWCSAIICYHIKPGHEPSYLRLDSIPSKYCFKSWYIFVPSRRIEYVKLWAYAITCWRTSTLDKQSYFPNRRDPPARMFMYVLNLTSTLLWNFCSLELSF